MEKERNICARHAVLRFFRELNKVGVYNRFIQNRMNVYHEYYGIDSYGSISRHQSRGDRDWFEILERLEKTVSQYTISKVGWFTLLNSFNSFCVSFDWSKTPEGDRYWRDICDKFWKDEKLKRLKK